MKAKITFLLLFAASAGLNGQSFPQQDTLILENFEEDPAEDMLPFPSGDDLEWVNYDEDFVSGSCVLPPNETPYGWFQEGDFSVPPPEIPENDAFTSCSFFFDFPNVRNANWLITSPVEIPDSTYWLCWRSLSYYGPGYLDGYHVLVSTTSNDPAENPFQDTLFAAAEMVEDSNPTGSLNLDDYVFSDGYIHANGYTDSSYFFVDYSEGPPFYHGKLEPHAVSLAAYSGKKIYIAFLHDSQNDFFLQVDDIIVSRVSPHVSVNDKPGEIYFFQVMPNPVRDAAYVTWKMKTPQEGKIYLADQGGKVVAQQNFSSRAQGSLFLGTQHLVPGIYYCTLETAAGRATTKLVKI